MEIIKTHVVTQSRALKYKWRMVIPRLDAPTDLDLSLFPHSVDVADVNNSIPFDDLLELCNTHVGKLDEDWTYTDSDSVRFKDPEHAVWFLLSVK